MFYENLNSKKGDLFFFDDFPWRGSVEFLLHTVFILVLFLPNADASDYDIFMRRGLETLYLQEAEKYVTCRQYTRVDCNFSEVEGFLRLLALYSPDERIAPIYPKQAQ